MMDGRKFWRRPSPQPLSIAIPECPWPTPALGGILRKNPPIPFHSSSGQVHQSHEQGWVQSNCIRERAECGWTWNADACQRTSHAPYVGNVSSLTSLSTTTYPTCEIVSLSSALDFLANRNTNLPVYKITQSAVNTVDASLWIPRLPVFCLQNAWPTMPRGRPLF